MVHHEYSSPEYFAQEFAKCVGKKGDYSSLDGVGFRAEHHGNRVDFFISGVKYEIYFEPVKEKVFARLEAVVNGTNSEIFKKSVKIERSPHGKISPKSYNSFFMDRVMDAIKTYMLSDSK